MARKVLSSATQCYNHALRETASSYLVTSGDFVPVNAGKPHLWKTDVIQSVDFYNDWFIRFAPKAYRDTRLETSLRVKAALEQTFNLTNISPNILIQYPSILSILRMTTAPPIARDRLIGLAGVSPNLVESMEVDQRIPPRMSLESVEVDLRRVGQMVMKLADEDIFPWLESQQKPTQIEVDRAATIVADRLCGAVTDPIIRNSQEQRQLNAIKKFLEKRGYQYLQTYQGKFNEMKPGTFAFRLNVQVLQKKGAKQINIPIDAVIMPLRAKRKDLPLLVEAKSAGDYTNTNKRRKEEATKVAQLKSNYGKKVRFVLFLCGYFDSGYLGYEAAEGIDWVWEHRIEDLAKFGV
jgi:hypothetical protein